MPEIKIEDVCGRAGKIVIARIHPGSDVIEGVEEACKRNGIKCAYASCIGSVRQAGYFMLEKQAGAKIGAGYGGLNKRGWSELVSCTGFVSVRDGKCDSHFHATWMDMEGNVAAGHMVSGQNPVFATIDMFVMEVEGVEYTRRDDEEVGLPVFTPQKASKTKN